ncbi:MAG TPA: flagellar export protein FliJ [Lachnoclostridium phytofermentans]|uniref:Flagellar FliJ protein n=2 Tax=Lachnoclostridium TaxID=1506553 RepID=A0A3D2X9E8_9FIRM|nr:flagellar export protein FliJ [Lachnoclostridium phytofermentans]
MRTAMKKFVYPMQSILNIKNKLEEQEKNNYGIAKAKLIEEEHKLMELVERKDSYEFQIKEAMSSTLNIANIRRLEDAIESMKQFIKQQTKAVVKAEQAVELAMQRLKSAMIERKTHDKLRENAFDSYLKEYAGEEMKEIDELVSFQYGKKAKEIV